MRLLGSTRVRAPVINGVELYRELCLDTAYLPHCLELWNTGQFNQIGVECNENAFKLDSLECLEKFDAITRVRITMDRKIDLRYLSRLAEELDYLQINDQYNAINDLSPFVGLISLSVPFRKGVKLPEEMPKLESLGLSNFLGVSLDEGQLPHAPKLESLGLVRAKRLEGANGIERYPTIRKLGLAYCGRLSSIDSISSLKYLEDLEIHSAKEIDDLSVIGKLKNLVRLILNDVGAVTDLSFLRGLDKLRHFSLSKTELKMKDVNVLFELRELNHVHIEKINGIETQIEKLGQMLKERKSQNGC